MFKYRLEERPVVQHQADGSYMDIVELFPFREIPRFIDVYILEPKIWGAWHFQLDGVDDDEGDETEADELLLVGPMVRLSVCLRFCSR